MKQGNPSTRAAPRKAGPSGARALKFGAAPSFAQAARIAALLLIPFSIGARELRVTGRSDGDCRLRLENVLFRRLAEPRLGQVTERATLEAERCTFEGIAIRETGTARWTDSLLDGASSEPGASGADLAGLQGLVPEKP